MLVGLVHTVGGCGSSLSLIPRRLRLAWLGGTRDQFEPVERGLARCWVLRRHPGGVVLWLLLAWTSNAPRCLCCVGVVGLGGLGCGCVLSVA